jgi:hypothetical protein
VDRVYLVFEILSAICPAFADIPRATDILRHTRNLHTVSLSVQRWREEFLIPR